MRTTRLVPFRPTFLFLSFLLNLLRSTTLVKAFVYAGNESFPTLPALFGRALPTGVTVTARLQFLPESPYLCEPLLDYQETSFIVPPRVRETDHNSIHKDRSSFYQPVALLVARGQCPFIRKAVVAESLHPSVQYLLVYNSRSTDTAEIGGNDEEDLLVPMYSEFGDSRLILLSLSHASGQALKHWMVEQPKTERYQGGPFVQLDALPPPIGVFSGFSTLSVEDLRNMLITAMALLLALIIVSGCLLMAAGTIGHVHVSGNRIVVTTTATNGLDAAGLDSDGATVVHHHFAIGGGRRLLSEAQVQQLYKDQQEATREQVEKIVLGSWARQREQEQRARDEGGLDPRLSMGGDQGEDDMDGVVDVSLDADVNPRAEYDDQDHSCAICIDELYDFEASPEDALDYRVASSLLTLPCQHTFHLDCLIPWLSERQSKCPLCKFDVFDYVMSRQMQERSQRIQQQDAGGLGAPPRRRLASFWNGIFGAYSRIGQQEEESRRRGNSGDEGTGLELTEREEAIQELEMATAELRRTADRGLLT